MKLLDDISVKTIGLLFPPELEFLGLYRAAIRVVYKTALDGLSFYLLIPLRGDPTDTFDVLKWILYHILFNILMLSCYIIYQSIIWLLVSLGLIIF